MARSNWAGPTSTGSYVMGAFPVVRFTETSRTPLRFFTAPSTVATHDAQDMPTTGRVASATAPTERSAAPWICGRAAIVDAPAAIGGASPEVLAARAITSALR